MDWILLAFAFVVFASYAVQTIAGFGSMLLCVTLGALLYPIDHVLTLVVPISLLQTGYVVVRHKDGIHLRLLLGRILPLMGLGLLGGRWLASEAPGPALRTALGVLVLVLSVRELWRRRPRPVAQLAPAARMPQPLAVVLLLGAGVVHGVYATGGPLLVYVIGRLQLPKHVFRSTVTSVWLVLNSVLCMEYARAGRFDGDALASLPYLLPAIPLGIWVGELLHHRVDERRFELVVYGLLLVASLVLLSR